MCVTVRAPRNPRAGEGVQGGVCVCVCAGCGVCVCRACVGCEAPSVPVCFGVQ